MSSGAEGLPPRSPVQVRLNVPLLGRYVSEAPVEWVVLDRVSHQALRLGGAGFYLENQWTEWWEQGCDKLETTF